MSVRNPAFNPRGFAIMRRPTAAVVALAIWLALPWSMTTRQVALAEAPVAAPPAEEAPVEAPEIEAVIPDDGLPAGAVQLANEIDRRLADHHRQVGMVPAEPAGDLEFLRRVSLDLLGRIPTAEEAQAFANDRRSDKRAALVAAYLAAPEYPMHLGRVLDGMIQSKHAGDAAFLAFVRESVRENRGWDDIFRRVLIGPWEKPTDRGAANFLARRIRSLDDLTNDTSTAFFGINVSCAKCHDHPLVADWKQAHFYGLQSFFARTIEDKKTKLPGEKNSAQVQYVDVDGKQHTAELMFLSGTVIDEAEAKESSFSARQALVETALEQRVYFSRAAVNQLWAYFLGQGLVEPVDQLHSANSPSVPGLLDWLADDFAAHDYDLQRLVAAIVLSEVYGRSSLWNRETPPPSSEHFALAAVRPLTPEQYALSLRLALGDGRYGTGDATSKRLEQYLQLEKSVASIARYLDPAGPEYQSSVSEALFMSNHGEVYQVTAPSNGNLTARLLELPSPEAIVDAAMWNILSRPAKAEEQQRLTSFLKSAPNLEAGVRDMVWALLTSAEFRFNW